MKKKFTKITLLLSGLALSFGLLSRINLNKVNATESTGSFEEPVENLNKNNTAYSGKSTKASPITYTISFNPGEGGEGGSVSPNVYATSDSSQTVIISPPRKQGSLATYSITTGPGYNGEAPSVVGNKVTIPAGARGPFTVNTSWTIMQYTIMYNPGTGVSGSEQFDKKTHGVPITLFGETYFKEGYTQTGWAIEDGGEKVYDFGATYSKDSATILYPVWSVNSYTVTLDSRGGEGGSKSVIATYGACLPPAIMPSKKGQTFLGYFDAISGGTKYINADGSSAKNWDKASETTLYAHWEPVQIRIEFDKQGGQGGDDFTNAYFSEDMPKIEVPSRAHYIFVGYYSEPNGKGTKYYNYDGTSENICDLISQKTLYAYWEDVCYQITFDKDSGEGGQDFVTAFFDKDMPNIEIPSKTDSEFGGYFSKPNGQGTKYYNADGTSAHVWDIGNKATLYAKWNIPSTTRCGVEAEWQKWNDSTKLPKNGYYYLATDVILTNNFVIAASEYLYLDLNGKSIVFQNGSAIYPAILVNSSKLFLFDSLGQGKIIRDSNGIYERAVCVALEGEFNMYGGTITGFTGRGNGCGVTIENGSIFNMYGGSFENCINTNWSGGGIYIEKNGTFNMYGGVIKNCSALMSGGAIYAETDSNVTIDGGTIDLNTAKIDGDGIYLKTDAHLIKNNGRFYTGNSYVPDLSGTSTITFDPNGGTDGIETMEATWRENLNNDGNPISVPTRTGCTFDGYYNAKTGGDKYFNADGTVTERTGDGQKWDYIGPVTLYAHWINPLEDFSKEFIDSTDGFCENDIDQTTQNNLKASFDQLSEENQNIFKNAVPQIPYVDSDIVVNAKSRYCYMISERGYDDFLEIFTEEELKSMKQRGNILLSYNDNNQLPLLIIVTCISFAGLALCVVLKKRNEISKKK